MCSSPAWLFSWALWRTGTLWVPIVFHALYNTVVFFVLIGPLADGARAPDPPDRTSWRASI